MIQQTKYKDLVTQLAACQKELKIFKENGSKNPPCAYLSTIKNLLPIAGSTKLALATVDGHSIVVDKAEYKIGATVVVWIRKTFLYNFLFLPLLLFSLLTPLHFFGFH